MYNPTDLNQIIDRFNKLSAQAEYAEFKELFSLLTYFAQSTVIELDRLHNDLAALDSKYDQKVNDLEMYGQPPREND
jgi:hypothetical protein